MRPIVVFRVPPDGRAPVLEGPDWKQASPRRIERALGHALARPSGGWYVLGASRELGRRPRRYRVEERDLVVWRDGSALRAGPEECPHMGAPLAEGRVHDGHVVCPWHGLALRSEAHGRWRPFPGHDDGVLLWVRLDPLYAPDELTDAPILTERPARFLAAVIQREASCEPRDVLANRLDPWHAEHFHPYAFGGMQVLEMDDDAVTVRVVKKFAGPLAAEVDARFTCPDPRTIAMTIVGGEGSGSVVETHATPIAPGRTAIIEATLATSDRPHFRAAYLLRPIVRLLLARMADRLWDDDAAYAERLYALRARPRPELDPNQA